MPETPDFDLRPTGDTPPERPPRPARSPAAWILAVALILAAAAAAYVFLRGRQPAQDATAGQPAAERGSAAAPATPLGGEATPIDVPPLNESDPLVRELVSALSSHPRIAAWLATDNLIRKFVVVVENIAYGTNPAPQVAALRPTATFRVLDRDGELSIDPRSYERYAGIADAAASVDTQGAADLYATLKPRIEEAWAELGRAGSFDQALERAIVVLLRTPVVEGDVPLTLGPVGYRFADPALERLSPAQKQLLRMGPRNQRVIQEKLRATALELGVPSENL
ncbi:MAG: DUF3014 domain-containing protein [Burkholderiales bacterium]